ncbi:Crp/Fnr family transcriptional regulator [Tardiphaga robiniae]|uniref:Crp/Fnr family transcriptional regulator n=1 Tax=Tardiphaga robiniae TaxID=943830 RepID=A0A7G6U1L5_9BRAD|nr:Crp/Fnr family transcriptional regulator [Tardiphaga robiniae]QND72897.1 Crp/Fnr family transcriptional regulator [Tardiphaga robiniae]
MIARACQKFPELDLNPAFHRLDGEAIQLIERFGHVCTLSVGQMLYSAGDPPAGIYAVLGGQIRLNHTNVSGKQVLFTLGRAGDWFGELSEADGLPRFHDAVAFEDSRILQLGRETYTKIISQNPSFQAFVIELLSRHLRRALEMLVDGKTSPIRNQLAQALLSLSQPSLQENFKDVSPRVSQEALAAMIGATRQTINKVLREFKRDDIVQVRYRQVIPKNISVLRDLANAHKR